MVSGEESATLEIRREIFDVQNRVNLEGTFRKTAALISRFLVCRRHILPNSEGMVMTECQLTIRRVDNRSL